MLVGDHGSVYRDGAVGSAAGPGLTASWDLTFAVQLTTTNGAIYELGTPEAGVGLVIQPFPDR